VFPLSCRQPLFLCALLLCCANASAKSLKIVSTPPGATVEFDGQIVGTTPFEKDFPSGYFQRPMTALQRRLEHPIHLRLTLPGCVTQNLSLLLAQRIGSTCTAAAMDNTGSSNPMNCTSTFHLYLLPRLPQP